MNGLHGALCVWIPELLNWQITKVATHGSLVDVASSAVDWQVVRGDQKICLTTQCRLYSNDRNVVIAFGPNSVDSDARTQLFGQCTNKLAGEVFCVFQVLFNRRNLSRVEVRTMVTLREQQHGCTHRPGTGRDSFAGRIWREAHHPHQLLLLGEPNCNSWSRWAIHVT